MFKNFKNVFLIWILLYQEIVNFISYNAYTIKNNNLFLMWSLFWQSFDVHYGFIFDTSLFQSFSMYFNIHSDKLSFSVLIWTCYMQMKRNFHESVIRFRSLIHFISTQCTYFFLNSYYTCSMYEDKKVKNVREFIRCWIN